MDGGPERIVDADERQTVRGQGARVHLQALALLAILTALAYAWP